MKDLLDRAALTIVDGGLVVYPTETFYGLGADALNRCALARIIALKGRPENKPLPVILGSAEQLVLITDPKVPAEEAEDYLLLAERFWPGPLSLLTKVRAGLPPEIQDLDGYSSVRVSGHEVARRLSLLAGRPIVATSANLSGRPPAAEPSELDPVLLQGVDFALEEKPWPSGGMPSTVAKPLGRRRLKIVRWGAVSREDLLKAGFMVKDG